MALGTAARSSSVTMVARVAREKLQRSGSKSGHSNTIRGEHGAACWGKRAAVCIHDGTFARGHRKGWGKKKMRACTFPAGFRTKPATIIISICIVLTSGCRIVVQLFAGNRSIINMCDQYVYIDVFTQINMRTCADVT